MSAKSFFLTTDKRKKAERFAVPATSRALFVAIAMSVLLAGCATSGEPTREAAVDVCKSPWAFVGNNGGKADRPAVAREMTEAHCA